VKSDAFYPTISLFTRALDADSIYFISLCVHIDLLYIYIYIYIYKYVLSLCCILIN